MKERGCHYGDYLHARPYRFPAAGEDFSEGPGRGGGKGHARSRGDQHQSESLAQEEVHGQPGQRGTDRAGENIEKSV